MIFGYRDKVNDVFQYNDQIMKNRLINYLSIILLILLACDQDKDQKDSSKYIITKPNGKIIFAYKAFQDFLDTDKSWDNFRQMLLEAYPEVKAVHDRQLGWGGIDSVKFPKEVEAYKKEDWEKYFDQYSEQEVHVLYDSIIEQAHKVLAPLNNNPVDLCLFLPYGGVFIIPGDTKNTIYISLLVDPGEAKKLMAHEYAHSLHFQRKPEEPSTLKREMVSEGLATYLSTQIVKDLELLEAIPFMPESSVNWCLENEQLLKDSLLVDLEDTTQQFMLKYIADGDFATPPDGFVQKTAYFAGSRIIEACIQKGLTIEEISSMKSQEVIEQSGYFNWESQWL